MDLSRCRRKMRPQLKTSDNVCFRWPRALEWALPLHHLLRYFGDRLNPMPEYSVPVVESIKRALVEVRPLIDTGNKPISPAAVKKINEITTRLDGEIVTRQ